MVPKEALKYEKILNELMQRLINKPNVENLYPILLCLIDSNVYVPVNMNISREDSKTIENSQVVDTISLQNELIFKPDWLQNPNTKKYIFLYFLL